uniref:Glycoprotein n=1 Tax=Panagrellus redivivus TaxID=6233 RepID=A0A7E4W4Q8_PANRE
MSLIIVCIELSVPYRSQKGPHWPLSPNHLQAGIACWHTCNVWLLHKETTMRCVTIILTTVVFVVLTTLLIEDSVVAPFGIYYTYTEDNRDYRNILFDNCELPHLNPWDPSILKFLKPDTKYECKPKIAQLTKLENGQLSTTYHHNFTKCMYRCLHPVSDKSLLHGDWVNLKGKAYPTCDVIETHCFKENASKPYYEFVHAQIYRSDKPKPEKNPDLPDVHFILLDSLSHSSFVRTMPRTYHELMTNYEAIPFPHLNKVSLNSRPNGAENQENRYERQSIEEHRRVRKMYQAASHL